ncbi:MAG: cyclodeaminase/cyclohydrolase family protein [Lachnospiraceae bacterium]
MDYTKQSCENFITVLASKEPAPGGGGAAALVGAIGMALGSMVGSLTLGKKKYADVQDDILDLQVRANIIQAELLELVKKDAEAFEPLSRAYGMPKDTAEKQAEKVRVMETCLRECCDVPLEIMKRCCDAIALHQVFAEKGTAIAISDVGCGVACCKAALQAASLNVFINTKSMTDRTYAEAINKSANRMLDTYITLADQIYVQVAARFK